MSEPVRLRLFPVAIAALAALVVLKLSGLVLNGGYTLSPVSVAVAQDTAGADAGDEPVDEAMQPDGEGAGSDETASAQSQASESMPGGINVTGLDTGEPVAPLTESERAVLESLRERRKTLEKREADLLMRENLLRAAEQRVDEKVMELKAIEKRIQASINDKEDADDEQFADLVAMYENMKAKSAARIFDRLDVDVLVGVAKRMNPEALAAVLARMDPAVAEQVTVELAQISERNTGLIKELDAIVPQ